MINLNDGKAYQVLLNFPGEGDYARAEGKETAAGLFEVLGGLTLAQLGQGFQEPLPMQLGGQLFLQWGEESRQPRGLRLKQLEIVGGQGSANGVCREDQALNLLVLDLRNKLRAKAVARRLGPRGDGRRHGHLHFTLIVWHPGGGVSFGPGLVPGGSA